jgi:hypothetical protein
MKTFVACLGNGCVIGTDATEGFVELGPTESFERQCGSVGTDGGFERQEGVELVLFSWYRRRASRGKKALNWYASVGTDGGLGEARPLSWYRRRALRGNAVQLVPTEGSRGKKALNWYRRRASRAGTLIGTNTRLRRDGTNEEIKIFVSPPGAGTNQCNRGKIFNLGRVGTDERVSS